MEAPRQVGAALHLRRARRAHRAAGEPASFDWPELDEKSGAQATDAELRAPLKPNFAKFWRPEAVLFLEQIPRTSTSKCLKAALRQKYGELLLGR